MHRLQQAKNLITGMSGTGRDFQDERIAENCALDRREQRSRQACVSPTNQSLPSSTRIILSCPPETNAGTPEL
jgi:hypothetical protein